MTTTFTTNAGNSTLTMIYTATTVSITPVMDKAANVLYLRAEGSVPGAPAYSTLTLAQKCALVDRYTKDIYLNLARQYDADVAAKAASDAALAASATGFSLG